MPKVPESHLPRLRHARRPGPRRSATVPTLHLHQGLQGLGPRREPLEAHPRPRLTRRGTRPASDVAREPTAQSAPNGTENRQVRPGTVTSTGPDLMFLCRCGGFCTHPRPPGRGPSLRDALKLRKPGLDRVKIMDRPLRTGRPRATRCGPGRANSPPLGRVRDSPPSTRENASTGPRGKNPAEILSRGRFREGGAALLRAAAHLTLRRRHLNDRTVRLVDQCSG